MIRFGLLLLARTPLRSATLAAILTLVGGIALLFAWMSPSLQVAELAVWERLPADQRVGADATSVGDCVVVYEGANARASTGGRTYAHPDLVVGDPASLDLLSLRPPGGYLVLADPIAATAGQFAQGDVVEVSYGPMQFRGRVAVGSLPTKLGRAADGAIGVEPASLPEGAPEPDRRLCFGASDGPTVASVAAGISARQRSEGLTSATTMFGALAFAVWGVVLAMATTGVLRRRRLTRMLLAGLGLSAVRSAVITSLEVPGAGLLGLASGIALTLWLRGSVLRMWTDPMLVMVSATAFTAIVVVIWTFLCTARRREA